MTLGFIAVVVLEDHVSHRPLPRSQEWQPQDESASAKEQTNCPTKVMGIPPPYFIPSERVNSLLSPSYLPMGPPLSPLPASGASGETLRGGGRLSSPGRSKRVHFPTIVKEEEEEEDGDTSQRH